MSAEKNNGKDQENTASGCCDVMTKMMKNCCSDSAGDSDYFAKMKGMKGTYCGQKAAHAAKEDSQSCCG